jgi:hypothetical protein
MPQPATTVISLHWSKRVPLEKVKRLYESDARGQTDESLLIEVGHGIYSRCMDLLEYWSACEGVVTCRNCGRVIKRKRLEDRSEVLKCRCGWQLTWGEYIKKSMGHQLGPSDVHLLVSRFIEQWPKTKTAAEKMLLIDWIIHQFHIKTIGMGNTFGANVLAANPLEVFDFLNALAYGDAQPHQTVMREMQARWERARMICWVSKPKLQVLGKKLGVKGYRAMDYERLVEAILKVAPDQFDDVDALLDDLTGGLRSQTLDEKQTEN